jgi:uncharacterized protein YggE
MPGKNDSATRARPHNRHAASALNGAIDHGLLRTGSFLMRLFIVLVALALSVPAVAQTAPSAGRGPVITVHGDGKSEAAPDYAAISADVVTTASNLETASKNHRERATRAAVVLKALAAKGLEIRSSTFRLDRVTRPAPAGQKPPAPEYRAVTSFSLKTREIGAVDDIVTAIAATGLFEVHNLNFALDENTGALDAARKDAVADARKRAGIYAEAAGVRLGDVLEISDTSRRVPYMRAAAPMALERKMQVTPPETLAVHATVTITWRLKQQ